MVKILFIVLFLVGCSTTKTEYITVKPPPPPIVERPALPVLDLKEGDDPGTVIRAHRLTIKLLQKWGLELETILEGYR
jgi:hypothetical protein